MKMTYYNNAENMYKELKALLVEIEKQINSSDTHKYPRAIGHTQGALGIIIQGYENGRKYHEKNK